MATRVSARRSFRMRALMGIGTAAILTAISPASAFGQSTPVASQPAPAQDRAPEDWRYVAAAFVGSKFGDAAQEASVDLGGSFTWRFHRSLGVEVVGAYAPSVQVLNPELDDSRVNDLMFNAVTGTPLHSAARWHAFATGGLGLIMIHSDGFGPEGSVDPDALEDSQTLFGFNIGGGIVRFAGKWGVRAVLRYSAALGNENSGSTAFLNDVGYWRGNVGVAYRW